MNQQESANQREFQQLQALVEQQQHQLNHMHTYQPQQFTAPPQSPSFNADAAYHNAYQLSNGAQHSIMQSGAMMRSKTSPRSNLVNAPRRPAAIPVSSPHRYDAMTYQSAVI